ncbi:MAG: beta-galactosidase [Candidatus Omnitrophica bacterium]|nr:beta-galactosidase [Candidatus Omnitrophota bacterium]
MLGLSAIAATADIPRPEHPMPQMQRSEWLNLNGVWEFAETQDNADESFLKMESLPEAIVVPFCRESRLSGIKRTGFMKNVWYRRSFTVPQDWSAERIRLHIGACDWITRVWINGELIGRHQGGNAAFSFDITKALKPGNNIIIIHAFDDSAGGLQPLGKQSIREESHGIFYTRTTGIWQTVWLEGVGSSFIRDIKITPDPDHSRIILQAEVDGPSRGLTLHASAGADGKVVGAAETDASWRNNYFVVDLAQKNLWSLDHPFLYDLNLSLKKGNEVVDELNSYFGLRKVTIEGGAILLNDQPVFQRLVLDQGFNPDGIWTSPTDEFLRGDIALSKAAGFNGARLHQKVFEPRFLYWADKLGYLVWGEYPSYGADYSNPVVNRPIIDEWVEIVRRDRNHPSIIGWCPFNETPGSAGDLQNTVVRLTRALDPSRPVLDTSGWSHSLPDPEVMDAHDYNQNPAAFKDKWENYFQSVSLPERYGGSASRGIPFFVSEFGGIGWFESEDGKSWGYGNSPKTLEEFYERFAGLIDAQLDNRNLCGYCYTQLTDVEQEKNGIFKFDRTAKFDAEKLHGIQSRRAAYEIDPPLQIQKSKSEMNVLLGAAPDGMKANLWKYNTDKPANDWHQSDFDDSSWKEGCGGFGDKGGSEQFIGTPWKTKDIWLRRTFVYDGAPFESAQLAIHYDNETSVYINGKLIWNRKRWNDGYEGFDITEKLRGALKKGENLIAVHCHQDDGGQFIDAAILVEPSN